MVKSSTFFRVSLGLATLLGSADAVVFLPTTMFKILFGKQEKGPGVLVDVIGADLLADANGNLDVWWQGSPDTMTKIRYGSVSTETQIESSTYRPRWYWSRKLKYQKGAGMEFTVTEMDVLCLNTVVGRCFASSSQIEHCLKTSEPLTLSLGENIGTLKVAIHGPMRFDDPKKLDAKGGIAQKNELLLADARSRAVASVAPPP